MTPPDLVPSSWDEYKRLILAELESARRDIEKVNQKVDLIRHEDIARMRTDIALLKFQALLAGSVAGAIVTGIITLLFRVVK